MTSPPRPVSGFAAVGVTWDRGDDLGATTLHVRTSQDGEWSAWHDLEAEDDDMPDSGTAEAAATRPGTAPVLIGDVDRVQVKVVSVGQQAPEGLDLTVIDPGTSSADAAPGAPALAPSPHAETAAAATVARPEIYSRAQWGADEDLRSGTPSFGTVQTTFVHHTVNANDYSAADVPAIMRSIYAYHTQARGWSDIGYNVLVDRFGRLWEGRYGGLERNVIGAHTLDYNEEAFGVSAIGNFEEVRPTTRMLDALARVLAWKLDKAGLPAVGSRQVQGVSFKMINGHRDAAATACPGGYLYAALPAIRTRAAAVIAAGGEPEPESVERDLRRTLNADTRPDVVVREAGALRSLLGDAGPGFLARAGTGSTAGRLNTVTGVGDWNSDGTGDVLVRYRRSGTFEIRTVDADGGMSTVVKEGNDRFAKDRSVVGAPDLTGDGLHDLIITGPKGAVRVAPGQEGGFERAVTIFKGWAASRAVLGAGDLDGDGIGDLLRIDADGVLWSLPGDGNLRYGAPVRQGSGWDGRTHLVAGSDLTGDARPDLMSTGTADGVTWIRPGTAAGGFGMPIGGWSGWADARLTTVTADASGDRFADAVVVDDTGLMSVRPSRHGMWLRPGRATMGDWSAYRWLRLVGDWNGDGEVDLAGVEGDQLWIFRGRGNGTFSARTGGWAGWAERGNLAALDDWDGDGRPDLISRSRDGSIWLYRGRGPRGVAEPVLLRPPGAEVQLVMPVGHWDADDQPDLVALLPGGVLQLWRGGAGASLAAPVNLTSTAGLKRYNRVMGVGDLNGDGRPDLLATSREAGIAYILPGGPAGVGTPIRVAGGWREYTMIA